MRTHRLFALSAALGVCTAFMVSDAAAATQHRYAGSHPLPADATADFCYIEAPHVHVYPPQKPKVLYRDYGEWNHFVGDPSPYGYEGPQHAYHGAHPVAMEARVEVRVDEPSPERVTYCYIEGPHYHAYEPALSNFEVKGDVHWYVGDYGPKFHEHRPRYARINAVYEPFEYERPVVEIEPPSAYTDVLVEVRGPPGKRRGRGNARGHVGGGIRVEVPTPSFEIRGSIGVGTRDARERPPPRARGKHRKFKKHRKHRKFKHRKFKHRKYRGR